MLPPVERFRFILNTICIAHSVIVMTNGVKPREIMSKVLFQVGSIFLARNLKRLFFEKKNAIMQTHDTSCESIVARRQTAVG